MTEAQAREYAEMYACPEAAAPLLLAQNRGCRRAAEALQWLDLENELPPPESAPERAARAIGVYIYLAMIHDPRRLRRVLEMVGA